MFSKEYIQEYKQHLKIAYPVALSQLGHMVVGLTDTFMVSGLGEVALASVPLAFSIHIPFLMLGIGISYGISPLVAKADGENNRQEISKILKHGIVMNGTIGILMFLALYFSSSLFWNLRQPDEVVRLAIPFFEILAISMIPLMFFQVFRQFAEGHGVTRQAMYISVGANIINIVLNYLLIYGKFGFPALGVNGAGYATLIARIFMAFAMFAFVYKHPRFQEYWKQLASIAYSSLVFIRMLKMTLPVGVQLSLEAGAFGFAGIMVGSMGADKLAAHHIALTLAAVPYMAATGIASATTVRVGNEFGRKDYFALRRAGLAGFSIAILFMSFSAIVFLLLKNDFPYLFISETKTIQIASSLLLITAFFQLSDGIQVVGLAALRGIGDVRRSTAIALVSYWLIGLPVGYLFAFPLKLGAEGVWYGLFLGLLIAASLLFIRFNRKSKKLMKA